MTTPTDSRGWDIPPHELEVMSEAAHKIVKLLLVHKVLLNRAKTEAILDIVRAILNAKEVDPHVQ